MENRKRISNGRKRLFEVGSQKFPLALGFWFVNAIIILMNRKQQKIFDAIFSTPTKANIKFSDIEKLLVALGAERFEGSGSRVAFVMPNGEKWEHHRPHPSKEARKYQVESAREFLKRLGYTDE